MNPVRRARGEESPSRFFDDDRAEHLGTLMRNAEVAVGPRRIERVDDHGGVSSFDRLARLNGHLLRRDGEGVRPPSITTAWGIHCRHVYTL